MGRLTTAERRSRQKELIRDYFTSRFRQRFGDGTIDVYEAPSAGSWVVIAKDEAWVWDRSNEQGLICFWGPLGVSAISFPKPEEWPA